MTDDASRRASAGLDGFLVVDKPAGVTSHDVVESVRARLHGVRTGHGGALDPAATGVLVVGVGRATARLSELSRADKEYEATVRFGVRTDTDDLDGRIVVETQTPAMSAAGIEALVSGFVGSVPQRAPEVSALKHRGEAFHAIRRRGGRPPERVRTVVVHEIRVGEIRWPDVEMTVRCGGGTYIRALARDLGERVGCGAALASLRRTRVGPFAADGAWSLARIERAGPEEIALALRMLP